jgi:adenosylhomocysteinase
MVEKTKNYAVKNMSLSSDGKNLIHWAEDHMPVLMRIRADFEKTKPLKGLTLGCCLHVTKETAVLVRTLKSAGASVALCGSNPLSTNDAVAAALAKEGIFVYAWRGVTNDEYYWCVNQVLNHKPNITMDDGSDLVTQLHTKRKEGLVHVIAGTEETTTGVNRQRIMA